MDQRDILRQILDKPVIPDGNPLDTVTDYLLDNDVIPVVRCKDCRYFEQNLSDRRSYGVCTCHGTPYCIHPTPGFYCYCGERKNEGTATK